MLMSICLHHDTCALRSPVDRAHLAARDEQEGAGAAAARAAAAERGGSK